jgi:hypothetical protein
MNCSNKTRTSQTIIAMSILRAGSAPATNPDTANPGMVA